METKERTITMLDPKEHKVLKRIIINNNAGRELGHILYTRQLTDNYNFKNQEKEFPHDSLDKILFDAINEIYPQSILRNECILFNVDLDTIKIYKNRLSIPATIFFRIDTSKLEHRSINLKQINPININIYGFIKPEYPNEYTFYATYDALDNSIFEN